MLPLLRGIIEILAAVISGEDIRWEMPRWRQDREFQMGNSFMKCEIKLISVKSNIFPISEVFLSVALFGNLTGYYYFFF